MRLTTDFFVSALIRRVFAAGGFAAVVRHGTPEAGAVFVVVGSGRLGERALYGPAPQTSYDADHSGERQFQGLIEADRSGSIDLRLEREAKFDPDHWVVDVELASGSIEDFLALTRP